MQHEYRYGARVLPSQCAFRPGSWTVARALGVRVDSMIERCRQLYGHSQAPIRKESCLEIPVFSLGRWHVAEMKSSEHWTSLLQSEGKVLQAWYWLKKLARSPH